ncbi:peptidase M20 [Thermaurantimonas aggregans]|uniref:Peptidase M20 n=1 Tax=Thermaurantimonas aggregans TaxID=2173829 RepID=A0A401XLK1_9FLAO|nr:M20/M25/M40 family metallo-hydrolase [Thermaurantimonas aggregans]MCX8149142.1 M20/M25/M40 family metallo-hydrolase [Thermaurantimonas aggregans]GCD77883.1 peptidase M20 [Thermaurantimonas aggregans]
MKKLLLVLLVALVLLISVVIWRTLRFHSPLDDITPSTLPVEWIIDEEAAINKLREALTYPTISHRREMMDLEAFQGFLAFLGKSFPKVFAELRVDTVNDFTLLFTWQGTDPSLDPIVLMGHYDVVPVEATTLNRWDAGPFSGDTVNGYVYGRGAIDNKTPCIAILETVENLLSYGMRPKRSLLISLGHDEEIGGDDGAVQVVKLFEKRNIRPALVLDEGGTLGQGLVPGVDDVTALIGTAEKGYLSVELLVKGAGGHSSMPERNNTLSVLTEAMHRINEHPMPFEISDPVRGFIECMGPHMQFPANMAFANTWLFKPLIFKTFSKSAQGAAMLRTTQVPTIVSGGVKDNVIPNLARAVYNFRLLPGHTDSMIIDRLRALISDSSIVIRPIQDAPYTPGSKASPYDDQVFRQLAGVVKTTFPKAIVSPYLVLGATDARHFTGISTHVYRFNPILLLAEDLPRIHGINERVGIDDYLAAIQFYAQFIQHFCIDDGLSKDLVKGKI